MFRIQSHRTVISTSALLLALLLVVALAACGGSQGEEPGTADDPQDSGAAADTSESEGEEAAEGEAEEASSEGDDLVAAAQEEGQVTFYSSLPEEKNAILAEAFEEEYGIPVEVYRAGSLRVQGKLYEELQANALIADVFHSLYPPGFYQLMNDGHITPYESPELDAYSDDFIGPDNYWGTLRVVGNVIMYNTETLGDLDPPETWEDLLKPEYAGMVASADPTYGGTQFMQYYMWKENYGEDYIRELVSQDMQMVDSHGALASLIVPGERAIAVEMNDYQAWSNKYLDGAPVDYVYPPENVLVVPGPIAILEEAPNPNAARLFYDFLLSAEGQQIIQDEVGAYSARSDAQPIEGRPALSEIDQYQPDWQYLLENEAAEQELIVDLLAGG